jgi:predicted house-cleaning noncanonical NTP pyrophosphatase (MazG superfamily)
MLDEEQRKVRKIVRDGLVDRIPPEALRLPIDESEALTMLHAKIAEESDEIRGSAYADPSEYADCLEVLMALSKRAGVEWATVESCRIDKLARVGGFESALIYDPGMDHTRG